MPHKDPLRRSAYILEWSRRPKARTYQRNYREENAVRVAQSKRACMLKDRYGITEDDYNAMLEKQGGGCAACGSPDSRTNRSKHFDVDHDHVTGKVRGLLCRPCNLAVGWLEGKRHSLELARAYLELHAEYDPKPKPETT